MTFKVLHVTNSGALLESTVDAAPHVTGMWALFFPVGPVFPSKETAYCQKCIWIPSKDIDHNPSLSFPMYMAGNHESFIKDISKSVKDSSKKFMKIDNPSHCQKLL